MAPECRTRTSIVFFSFVSSLIWSCSLVPGVYGPAVGEATGICASTVAPNGYKCQEFNVRTEDGYILTMHRIPEGRNGDGGAAAGGQPVLLQHGLLVDGTTWVLNSPEESLAYVLADAGYDVWIANTRGTRWSRRHSTLDPSSPAYWRWSWDELAMYELPATVGFVYQKTGKKVDYVGHSMVAYRDGVPSKFDFGRRDANLRQYGQERPRRTTCRHIRRVPALPQLRRPGLSLRLDIQFVPEFAHVDFIIGVSAKTVVYDQILAFFRRLG
ncbi:unnamed protein product [Spirodela intermedia]|uniref:Partial AB-hydrolase lipase domain-containing protein n=1 Tax=Spirodela intermedia TaxID=51605 RepID=A0A7I8JDS2_SPIIN|nr:unnamed protein product [Spirodela intermedia]CAA6667895.1 unnamed protein product [Spirodela intermedia]